MNSRTFSLRLFRLRFFPFEFKDKLKKLSYINPSQMPEICMEIISLLIHE